MKKLIAALITLLLLCCPVTVLAAEANPATVPSEQGIAVYGRIQSTKDYYEIVLGKQGADSVTLPNGITFGGKSDSQADNGLHVIIIPVTAADEADAYAWMTEAAKDLGKNPTAYYLMFYREDALAQPKGHITVSSTENGKNKLCYMDGSAASKELPCSFGNGVMSFAMERSGYYITVTSASAPHPSDSPQTGDTSNVWVYFLMLVACTLLLIFLWRARKKPAQ